MHSVPILIVILVFQSNRAYGQALYTTGKKYGIFYISAIFFSFLWGVQVFLYLQYIPLSKYYFSVCYFALNSQIKHMGLKTITLVLFLY